MIASQQETVHIRRAIENDLNELCRLYAQLNEGRLRPEASADALRRTLENPDYYLMAAQSGGALMGTALGIVCHDVSQGVPFMLIENVVVDASARRQGVGQALIGALEAIARDHHCSLAMLLSGCKRKGAHAFYERLGYSCRISKGFKKRFTREAAPIPDGR